MANKKYRVKSSEIKGQKLPYPAKQSDMDLQPQTDLSQYKAAGKLTDRVAIITGADSGIGRAVAIGFAKEGADVAIVYNVNDSDAETTKKMVEETGRKCLVIKADVRQKAACFDAIKQTVDTYGKLNILVNNAAYQHVEENLEDITEENLRRTFDTNIIAYFFMAQGALPHLKDGDAIINTGSIVGISGLPILLDYTASKGAIHSFTKSLALQLGKRNIRVNCVIPGPVWTPNIPGTMPMDEVANFGHEVALERPGQPEELAPAYILLASDDGSFMTGSLVQVTGGRL
ncbi:SDR family oxidoreductase [Gelidibacter gilvus]|uniref:SDR family oxidoreductase n=1 Tax=Gelidibacter gilvus TaxID=59602 RepID=A0A4Q0XB53_9FLAO|nr:SDR family oxidoreductase [Gelidibacter gilvus]RXJ44367.1 SDR family oxidoreductase [Gelidibacter gilvus]